LLLHSPSNLWVRGVRDGECGVEVSCSQMFCEKIVWWAKTMAGRSDGWLKRGRKGPCVKILI
jgi:hypothetical protein